MAPQAPPHVTAQAEVLFNEGHLSASANSARLGYNKRTIERWRINFELYGDAYPPPVAVRGRPRALTTEQMRWLLSYLDQKPAAYCDEISIALYDEWGVEIAARTVGWYLVRQGWSRTQARRRDAARSAPLRALWCEKSGKWSPEQLVFCDESAANNRTRWRRYGWSPRGQYPVVDGGGKGDRYSILPLLTINGYLPASTLVVKGSVKRDLYLHWLQHTVLPLLTPGYHILVMDNRSTHHGEDIQPLCDNFGIQLEYLPPYSPDHNPIESTFGTLKQWIRRHWDQREFAESFEAFLMEGFRQFEGFNCEGYYRNCGYGEAEGETEGEAEGGA